MDASSFNALAFSEDESEFIVSTRIRVARNLVGYPLGPGMNKDQRHEIMNKVAEACGKLEGDLKGNFYPLQGMSDTDRN